MRSPVPPDRMAGYPPAGNLMAVHCAAADPDWLSVAIEYLAKFVRQAAGKYQAQVIGPADEPVAKINDIYRKAIYIKHDEIKKLTAVKNLTEQYVEINTGFKDIRIQYEVN